jgi:hypothetical protein
VGAWSFGKRQGTPKTGQEHGSRRPEHGRERGSGVRTGGGRFGNPGVASRSPHGVPCVTNFLQIVLLYELS